MPILAPPRKPGRVLTKGLNLGLSATLALARERVTDKTYPLYGGGSDRKGMRRIWDDAKREYYKTVQEKSPKAAVLQDVENNIRRSFQKIMLKTSVRYGNTEVKRKRRGENKKYLNQLWDYAGSRLRDMATERYPFPGVRQIVNQDGAVVFGYLGSSRDPEYIPTHSMPELDFVDMIRSHLIELCRQCLKYGLPQRAAKRYIDDLIDRLTPFLDYVYTSRRSGRAHFTPDGAKELREIVLRIRTQFGKRNGRSQSITSTVSQSMDDTETTQDSEMVPISSDAHVKDDDELIHFDVPTIDENKTDDEGTVPDYESEECKDLILRIVEKYQTEKFPDWEVHIELIKALVENGTLTHRDAEHILQLAVEESRRMGVALHDFISNAYSTRAPFTMYGPIRYGDTMAPDTSGLLLIAEVSVAGGTGRVDLVLFRRKTLPHADDAPDTVVWEPCMVIEIKTRSSFNLDLYAIGTKSSDLTVRVVEPVLDRRKMTDDEWERVIAGTPSRYEKMQLGAYTAALISDYRRIARADDSPPDDLIQAVLVVDSKENWEEIRERLLSLVINAYRKTQQGRIADRELFQPEDRFLHMGLVVFSGGADDTVETPLQRLKHFDSFRYRRKRRDDRKFTLYLSVAGKGSPAESAARVAAKWHGLQYVHQLVRGKHRDVVWFDLTGEYSDPTLRATRLRLKSHSSSIQRFVKKRVRFVDLSSVLRAYIHDRDSISDMTKSTRPFMSQAHRPFIIVTGWDMVRRSTPEHLADVLDEFLIQFLDDVPKDSKLVWFGRPVPLSATSQRYDTRCVGPFYTGSPWMHYVDEIVWNTPMPPPRFGAYAPADDDVRMIVIESPNGIETKLVVIDVLREWGERFRSDEDKKRQDEPRQKIYHKTTGSGGTKGRPRTTYGEEDIDTALELLPHICAPMLDSLDTEDVKTHRSPLPDTPDSPSPLSSRLTLTPYQFRTELRTDGRVKRLEPMHHINHRREYRTTRLGVDHLKVNTRPPHEALMVVDGCDDLTIAGNELAEIGRALSFLRRNKSESKEWSEFLDDLREILVSVRGTRGESSQDAMNSLRAIRRFLELDALSRGLWNTLRKVRSWIPPSLNYHQRQYVERLLRRHPDILMITGNHLFLLLLAAVRSAKIVGRMTHAIEELWDYVVPWQLTGLGFTPEYHDAHKTGESILHRTKLLQSLRNRARALGILTGNTRHASNVKFGEMVLVRRESVKTSEPTIDIMGIWLIFQNRSGSHEMNATLVPVHEDSLKGPLKMLQELFRDRPHWGETDLTKLSECATASKLSNRTPIMVAEQRGLTGLWILEPSSESWTPVGRLEYFTRRREPVTLLRSYTLREERNLISIDMTDVRNPPSDLRERVDLSLELINAVFRNCESVECHVSVDREEQMYVLTFHKDDKEILDDNGETVRLLVKRTVDALELLHRPDYECEPVVVNGRRFAWNRFNDIEYKGDATVLRPWVERKSPFKFTTLGLPPTAEHLLQSKKLTGLELSVHHDASVCPLRSVPIEELEKRGQKAKSDVEEYLERIDGSKGQPDPLLNESIYRHGTCWRVELVDDNPILVSHKIIEEFRMGGPELAAILLTGCFMYQSPDQQWVVHEFDTPDTKSLPREFRECIHLMRARRRLFPTEEPEELEYPGSYLLKEWTPKISIRLDCVEFRLVSQMTLEVHSITVPEKNMGSRSEKNYREALHRGMNELMSMSNIEEDERLRQLIEGLIDELVSLHEISEEGPPLRLVRVSKETIKLDEVIKVVLVTEHEPVEYIEMILIDVREVRSMGGVHEDMIWEWVYESLSDWNIDNSTCAEIVEETGRILEEEGVVVGWE